jgi:acetylglutamate kinase
MLKVVKVGGNILEDPAKKNLLLDHFLDLSGNKVLVHGGGKTATSLASRLQVETKLIDGRRVTDERTLEVVLLAYPSINKKLVADLLAKGQDAVGLSGADMGLIISSKRVHPTIDYGFVGDIEEVNFAKLEPFFAHDIVPVICALTATREGQLLNTNADTIASSLAVEGQADELIYCFELPGVLANEDDEDSVIELLTPDKIETHIASGSISGGMIPKLFNAVEALKKGIKRVRITNYKHLDKGTIIQL